jgi:hypothetical protein
MEGVLRHLAITALVLAAACGGAAAAPSASPASPAPVERLLIEGDSATQIVAAATGRTIASLPGGMLSPSGGLVVRAEADQGKTAVRGVDLDGLPMLNLGLPGEYAFPSAYGAAPSGFSPNGKWLVLVSRDGAESSFAIIDTERNKLVGTVTLSSRFTFDAIHNDGSAMYLIEHPVAGATAYNVRLYDLTRKVLEPGIIFDKAQIGQFDPTVGLMDGTFHVSVAPTGGDWSYGLYMRPNGKPFVHALNVPGRYAQCILDLEGWWSPSSMFSMALSDDGRSLFVVDAVVGSISVIDGQTQRVSRTATFKTSGIPGDAKLASAALSRDGSRLYATAGRGVIVLGTADLAMKGWADQDHVARSVVLSSDGTRLYALVSDGIDVVDATSLRLLTHLDIGLGARALHILPRT